MELIIEKLSDPVWWFTGVFFILLGLGISKVLKLIPITLKKFNRHSKANSLVKIKKIRRNSYAIQYQICIDQSYFLIFCITGFCYLVLFLASPLTLILKQNFLVGMLLTMPLYIVEIIWLRKQSYVKKLVASADKLRIARRNTLLRPSVSTGNTTRTTG